ncbi:RF-1 domain-containing protein [Xylariales sp. AK1849]|nr:RF-1 domain-containing protein [Xylariales sp. AK1849]
MFQKPNPGCVLELDNIGATTTILAIVSDSRGKGARLISKRQTLNLDFQERISRVFDEQIALSRAGTTTGHGQPPIANRTRTMSYHLLRRPSTTLVNHAVSAACRCGHARALLPFSTLPRGGLLKSAAPMPPRPKPPPECDMHESFLKGSGPGGQKINKTNSAVQLKHIPTGLVIKCQATRSRSQNRAIARQLLADKLDDLTRGDDSRANVVGEVKRKKRASSAKKSRRKYRKLEEDKAGASGEGKGEGEGEDELEEEEGEDAGIVEVRSDLEGGRGREQPAQGKTH